MNNKELREILHKYFTALVHYQYEINHGTLGAEKEFKQEQEWQDNQVLEAIKQQKTQLIAGVDKIGWELMDNQEKWQLTNGQVERLIKLLAKLKNQL